MNKPTLNRRFYKDKNEMLSFIKKITDEQFIDAYNLGYSDRITAEILNVSISIVLVKRKKLGLIANIRPKLDSNELKESFIRFKEHDKNHKNRKRKKYKKEYNIISRKVYYSKEHHEKLKEAGRKHMAKSSKLPHIKARIKAYEKTENRKKLKRIALRKFFKTEKGKKTAKACRKRYLKRHPELPYIMYMYRIFLKLSRCPS